MRSRPLAQDLCLSRIAEEFYAQELITELPIEVSVVAVLPKRTWFGGHGFSTNLCDLLPNRSCLELRAAASAQGATDWLIGTAGRFDTVEDDRNALPGADS